MARHLIVYQSTHGQTYKICKYIEQLMMAQDIACDLKVWNPSWRTIPDGYASYLWVMPVRYGKHPPQLVNLLSRHKTLFDNRITGLISINLTARKPEKSTPETNPYCRKLLEKLPWTPNHTAVFAGALKYADYVWYDRMMIQLIMKLTGGPTDPEVQIEFTNWSDVDQFVVEYTRLLI